ncbi:hypothetical protein [Streptomyces sp. NPDC048312]
MDSSTSDLGQRHAPQEVGDPLRDGQRGVEVRRLEAHRSPDPVSFGETG